LLENAAMSTKRFAAVPKPVETPHDFLAALRARVGAEQAFDALSPSHRKEYVTWIEGAKKPETRARRIEKAVHMILECGK